MRIPPRSTVTASSTSNRAGSRSVSPAARENGSRLCSTSWLPSTAYACGSAASSSRSSGSPRGRETRSPVMHTRSGSRPAVHSTARATAREPREGIPRWKSERWTIRSTSRSPATGSSIRRKRTQPASNQPQPSPAAETPPKKAPARAFEKVIAPETAPPITKRRRTGGKLAPRRGSDFQLLEHRLDGDHVALELELRFLQAGRHPDEL